MFTAAPAPRPCPRPREDHAAPLVLHVPREAPRVYGWNLAARPRPRPLAAATHCRWATP